MMTRDELIDRMSVALEPEALAKAICHDAFDHFVAAGPGEENSELDIVWAWTFFRDGWDAAGDFA